MYGNASPIKKIDTSIWVDQSIGQNSVIKHTWYLIEQVKFFSIKSSITNFSVN
jgi:hypothetical protein